MFKKNTKHGEIIPPPKKYEKKINFLDLNRSGGQDLAAHMFGGSPKIQRLKYSLAGVRTQYRVALLSHTYNVHTQKSFVHTIF